MIGPINVLLIIFFLVVVPFILGLLLECYFEKKEGALMLSRCFALGFTVMLAAFQLVAVPMIMKSSSFMALKNVYLTILFILVIISVYLNYKTIAGRMKTSFALIKANINRADMEQKILFILAILLIIFQTSLLFFKMHTDTDDSRFLAEAMEAVEQNTLYKMHPITGVWQEIPIGEVKKDVTSPYPLFIATVASVTKMHPTVLAHTVFPILLIPLSYMVSYMIASFFFKDKKHVSVFMFVLSVIIIFSFESIYTWGYTLLTIIWQGRSIFSVIVLPLLWYVLMNILEFCDKKGLYIVLLCVALAAADLSGMGLMMTPIVGCAFALSQFVKNRKIIPAVMTAVCTMPCAMYTMLYFIIRRV